MIECKNLTKIYNRGTPKEVVAIKEADITIAEGEFVLLMGPSGSGKSTLLSLIAALTRPTSGIVKVDGEIVSKLPEDFAALYRREKIGFVFQKFHLIEDMSVFENVALPLVPQGLTLKEIEYRVQEAMERFFISHKASQRVSKLSGGEQQRVAIARSMVHNPAIILADEPTANLDSALTKQFIDILASLKEERKTIIVATHDPRFLELKFVDRVLKVHEGYVCNA